MPNPSQGIMLETAYQQLRNNVYAELMSQSHNSNLLDDIEIEFDTDKMQFKFNLDAITAQLQQAIAQDAVSRLGFNPTQKGLNHKTELKTAA